MTAQHGNALPWAPLLPQVKVQMHLKEIKSRIDELVEWDKPEQLHPDVKNIRKQLLDLGHSKKDVDNVLTEMLDNNRVVVDGVNITIPRKLKGIKHQPKICDLGCGQMAVDQRIDIKLRTWPDKHWVKKCNFCQYYKLPDGTFARNSQQYQAELIKIRNNLDK